MGVDLLAESLEAVEDGSVDVVETLLGGLVDTLMAAVFSSMATFILARFLSSKELRASKRSCNVLLRLLTASTRKNSR